MSKRGQLLLFPRVPRPERIPVQKWPDWTDVQAWDDPKLCADLSSPDLPATIAEIREAFGNERSEEAGSDSEA